MKDHSEGGLSLLFGLDQSKEIDEQVSTFAHLENVDNSKFGRIMKGLASFWKTTNFQRLQLKRAGF